MTEQRANAHELLIDPQTLRDQLDNPDWLLIDCQYDLADKQAGYQSYLAGHLPGAVYASLHGDLCGAPLTDHGRHPVPGQRELEEKLAALGVSNHKQVIAYDGSGGMFAARLWWLLKYAGHERVAALDGGPDAWLQAGFRLEKGPNQAVPGCFKAVLDTHALIKLQDVMNVPRLVDSRDPKRYAGVTEPMDSRAGHIPGAMNYCWKNNLDERGRFLPADALRQGLQRVYAGVAPEDVVFYCGSGVSACHNLLAASLAGYPLPGLYAGSWSEWSSDPERPVASGPE